MDKSGGLRAAGKLQLVAQKSSEMKEYELESSFEIIEHCQHIWSIDLHVWISFRSVTSGKADWAGKIQIKSVDVQAKTSGKANKSKKGRKRNQKQAEMNNAAVVEQQRIWQKIRQLSELVYTA